MSWDYVRTFKERVGYDFTFDCEIRENGTPVERRDFTVSARAGVAAGAQALKALVIEFIKLELLARSPQVTTPTVVPIADTDLV